MSKDNQDGKPAVEPAESTLETSVDPEENETESIDEAVIEDMASQAEAIALERDKLAAEIEELQNQVLRRQADFQNFRRRVENERADFTKYAGMEAVRTLLPILDDIERALKAAPPDESEFAKGVELIYQGLLDSLEKLGLEPIESVGQPFDPNFHHAVEMVETEEAEDHTVLEEWQKGYNFKGKLLREAMVKVSVKPSPNDSETTESK